MEKISLETRAKINLTLDIVNKRPDGYHNVSMVMQSIALCDTLHFEVVDRDVKIQCDNRYLPTDGRNIVYKAAKLIQDRYHVKNGIDVFIEKRIPFAAGLAGGSSNAAGTILALNKLWNLNLQEKELLELGVMIGADVPFCMIEGTALAEGIGEKLTRMNHLPEFHIVLIKPKISISTPWAYSLIDVNSIQSRPNNRNMIEAIKQRDKKLIASNLSNVFEDVIFKKYPELMEIKIKLKKLGATGELMSGSGPTVYGIFEDAKQAKKAKEALEKDYRQVFITQSYNKGGLIDGI